MPLPPDWAVSKNTTASSGAPEGPADSKDAIHALESAIITWTKQIKAVLKEDPEGLSTDERPHPGPVAELDPPPRALGRAERQEQLLQQLLK